MNFMWICNVFDFQIVIPQNAYYGILKVKNHEIEPNMSINRPTAEQQMLRNKLITTHLHILKTIQIHQAHTTYNKEFDPIIK